MSDEDDDRLLIDDVHETSGTDTNSNGYVLDPLSSSSPLKTAPTVEYNSLRKPSSLLATVGTGIVGGNSGHIDLHNMDSEVTPENGANVSREDGELEDEDTEVEIQSNINHVDTKLLDVSQSSQPISETTTLISNDCMPKCHTQMQSSANVKVDRSTATKRGSLSPDPSSGHAVKKSRPNLRAPTLSASSDRTTCVHTRAVQSECDESPFSLEPGSSFLLQMTVLCRLEGTNTMYVSAKWKDQDLSGILTDGEPPGFHVYAKKRGNSSVLPSAAVSNSENGDKSNANPTPTKKRIGRGGQNGDCKRKTANKVVGDLGAGVTEDVEEDLDVTGALESRPASGTDAVSLSEMSIGKPTYRCSFDGCHHKYDREIELGYHYNLAHKKKSLMCESICTQTELSYFQRSTVSTDVIGLKQRLTTPEKDSIHQLMKAGAPSHIVDKIEKEQPAVEPKSPGVFSDISDDGGAPQLQKEEPQQPAGSAPRPHSRSPMIKFTCPSDPGPTNSSSGPVYSVSGSHVPAENILASASLPSVSTSDVIHTPSAVVPPISASPRAVAANGVFVPGFPHPMQYMSSSFSSPTSVSSRHIPSPASRDHKIHQLRADGVGSEAVSTPATPTASKQRASPAQPRSFNMPLVQNYTSQQMAQFQQAAMQQMYMQHMALGGRSYPAMSGAGPNVQDQMTQYAAMQAAMGGNQPQFSGLFPK